MSFQVHSGQFSISVMFVTYFNKWELVLTLSFLQNMLVGGVYICWMLWLWCCLQWFCDSLFFSHNISESPEDSVKLLSEEAVPADRVTSAFECLPPTSAHSEGTSSGFRHWTIRDYYEAYRSGQITPTQVSQFLKWWKHLVTFCGVEETVPPVRTLGSRML